MEERKENKRPCSDLHAKILVMRDECRLDANMDAEGRLQSSAFGYVGSRPPKELRAGPLLPTLCIHHLKLRLDLVPAFAAEGKKTECSLKDK